MTPTIRAPLPGDVGHLHGLIREHAAFERSSARLTSAELADLLGPSPRPIRFLVADQDDSLSGYAAVTWDWSVWRARRYAHLECLFVAQAYRGHGIGRRLLAGAKTIASAEGVDRMEWHTPAWNQDAQRFYLREGASSQPKARFSLRLTPAAIVA